MKRLTPVDQHALINAIANREGTAKQLAERYGATVQELRMFVEDHRAEIEQATVDNVPTPDDITPQQLDDLWITNKFERLKRLQAVADTTYMAIDDHMLVGPDLAMAVREFRSYLMLAANELGQLLHRGSGDTGTGDTLSVDIQGIDMENLK